MKSENYYVQLNLINSLLKEIRNLKNKYLIFFFSLDEIEDKKGKEIKKILDIFKKENRNLFLSFVPPCIFSPEIEYLKFYIEKEKPPTFFLDDLGVNQILTKEAREMIPISSLYEKCVNCSYMTKGKCGGIYIKRGKVRKYKEQSKIRKWYFKHLRNMERGNILDLGSGITPFLEWYENLSSEKENLFFVCLEPMKFAIKSLDVKIKRKDRIIQTCGFGENIPFKENSFEVIMMKSSYSHFIDINKVLENSYRSLKNNGRIIIFEKKSPILEKTDLWMKHYRDHTLKEAVRGIKKHGFRVIDSLNISDGWGILAVKP